MTTTKWTACERRAHVYCGQIRLHGLTNISIQWRQSATWGSNPVISDYSGAKCCSVSGCGYCKESTALADVLQFLGETDEERNSIARTGGRGVSTVVAALASIGWKLECVAGSKSCDVYRLSHIVSE